jgi:hypothetical protein
VENKAMTRTEKGCVSRVVDPVQFYLKTVGGEAEEEEYLLGLAGVRPAAGASGWSSKDMETFSILVDVGGDTVFTVGTGTSRRNVGFCGIDKVHYIPVPKDL